MTPLPDSLLEAVASAAVREGLADAVFTRLNTPIGKLLVVQGPEGIARIGFEEEPEDALLAGVAAELGSRGLELLAHPRERGAALAHLRLQPRALGEQRVELVDAVLHLGDDLREAVGEVVRQVLRQAAGADVGVVHPQPGDELEDVEGAFALAEADGHDGERAQLHAPSRDRDEVGGDPVELHHHHPDDRGPFRDFVGDPEQPLHAEHVGRLLIRANSERRADAELQASKKLAEAEGVDVRFYKIIYEAIDDMRAAMEGTLAPEKVEMVIGAADVRETFSVPKQGTIAGVFQGELSADKHVEGAKSVIAKLAS